MYDLLVVGAGPNGLATALAAQKRGLSVVVLEKDVVASSVSGFPIGMVFFLGKWATEIGGLPMDARAAHPTREEALSYYRRVVELSGLDVRCRTRFVGLDGEDGAFTVRADQPDGPVTFSTKKLVLATGVFGQPRKLSVPGAELPKVHYGYRDPYAYFDRDVLIVGAGNGAAEAALRFHFEAGARVTVLNRGASIPPRKWRWYVGDLQKLTEQGAIRVVHEAKLERIDERQVVITTLAGSEELPNDVVVAIIGYRPDTKVFELAGVEHDDLAIPKIDPRTLETNVPGVYVAGAVCAGEEPDFILICGGRNHAQSILAHILDEPLPEIEDLGVRSSQHWQQFQRLPEPPDREQLMNLIPVVTGDFRDDLIDVYQHKLDHRNQELARAGTAVSDPWQEGVRLGPILDELPQSLLRRDGDGSVHFKGQKLSEDALEILRLADGSRRIRDIVQEIAEEYDEPPQEMEKPVLDLFLSLLRSGRVSWRASLLASSRE